MTAPDPVLLPDGARLVHIGPHKTGTSTLQGAFHLARRAASKQGVRYAGPNRQPLHAAQAIARLEDSATADSPALRHWRRLVADIRAAKESRVVASSEWFSDAKSHSIGRIADDLDPARVQIVVTLRPLGRILSSQWQQLAQAGHMRAYEPWLEAVFREPDGPVGRPFWHRHRHDLLVERWAKVFGIDRLTVVVADDRDRSALLRAFERLTGLRTGTLVAPDDRQNRSLTAAEIDLVRDIHVALNELGIDAATRMNLVLFGVAGHLKLRWPDKTEARIETPRWAYDASVGIARQAVDAIRASGVRVIGDLDSLATADGGVPVDAGPLAESRWPALAASASMGMLGATGLVRRSIASGTADGWPDELPAASSDPSVDRALASHAGLSTERLIGVLGSRVRESLAAWFDALASRGALRPEAPVHSPPEVEYRSRR